MKINIKTLSNCIGKEEVVFQKVGELVKLSNSENLENRESLLKNISSALSFEVYKKDDNYIREDFEELNKWSTNDDTLCLLQIIGTLICIPTKIAKEYSIIEN